MSDFLDQLGYIVKPAELEPENPPKTDPM